MRYIVFFVIVILVPLTAKGQHEKLKADVRDRIEVVGHVASANGPVLRLSSTAHYDRQYLYAENESGRGVTVIDVTRPYKPAVLGSVAYPAPIAGKNDLLVVSGTAAVTVQGAAPGSSPASAPQIVRIFDFSDRKSPKMIREFIGVTAIHHDERRALLFIADGEGIWILFEKRALDPAVEKEYQRRLWYDH